MDDKEQMLIFAARYALGRDNYAVNVTVNYLLTCGLSQNAQNIIVQDIRQVFNRLYTPQQQQWGRVLKAWRPKLYEELKPLFTKA